MAMMRLSEGWTLTSGVWPPFLLPEPTDIASALREQGILEPGQTGLSALYEQWIYAQRWVYALEFDAPGEDERFAIRFEALAGAGEIHVNGRLVSRFAAGETTVDVTGVVEPERNRLEVAFDPALWRGAPHGILGPVWLRTTSFLSLGRVRALERDGAIRVRSNLTAHSAGRYLFRYTVSLDDEAVLETGVYERLRAADAAVEHALELPSPVSWDGEKYYTVRLSVERSGVGCDMVRVNVAWGARAPMRVALLPAHRLRDHRLVGAVRALGTQAAAPEDLAAPPSAQPAAAPGAAVRGGLFSQDDAAGLLAFDLLPGGLLVADPAEFCEEDDLLALASIRALEGLAGGERFWPPGAPVWRATRSPCPEVQSLEALYGANALGDAARYARLSRFVQAEATRARALIARKDGRPLAVRAAEGAPACASHALIEYSGAKRPAYAALRQAWTTCAALLPARPFSAEAPLSVWMFSDGRASEVSARRPVTVTASVHALDGELIGSTSFAALTGATEALGDLAAQFPEEGVFIARVTLSGGERVSRIDQVLLTSKPGASPRGALLNPPRAALRVDANALVNTGGVAALGVFAGDFYGALLPGEKIVLTEGIDAEGIESLNGQIF